MAHKWNHNFPKIARDAGFIIREISAGYSIDWRFIASIDPYAIVSERDYEKLDEFIPHIAEVPIGTVLQNRILDPAIGKYFILAQFSIQYLMFCKQFLDDTIVELRNTAQDLQKENVKLEKNCRKKNEEIVALHRKVQKAENHHTQQIVYPCSKCTKNFISFELLNAHMVRKHIELSLPPGDTNSATMRKLSETDTNLINTIKLELEVKQLKERLNIAEKDLIDQKNREHQCHGCSGVQMKKKEVERDQNSPKLLLKLQSVAIQTNLEDNKDVNEKEVQTSRLKSPPSPSSLSLLSPLSKRLQQQSSPPTPLDVISKSDLEAILREQREQFECWKTAEREKLTREIERMRQNTTEAIREMDQRDRRDSLAVPLAVAEQRRASFEEETTVWKDRYHEMEKMYQDSQRQASQTVQNIESVYEKKFRQFEEMMQKHENFTRVEKHDQFTRIRVIADIEPDRKTTNDEKILTPSEAIVPIIEVSDDKVESEIEYAIEQPSLSDEVKDSESDEELKLLEAAKAKYLAEDKENSAVKRKESSKKREKALISPKKQILNTFKSRLKGLGIDSKTMLLPNEDMRAATIALAERRDANKRKNRTFFITRNQLSAKVDQLAKSKMNNSIEEFSHQKPEDLPKIKKQEAPHLNPKTRSSQARASTDILPSKLKIPANEYLSIPSPSTNPFKAKFIPVTNSSKAPVVQPEVQLTSDDIITVQAEINQISPSDRHDTISPIPAGRPSRRPSASEYDQRLQRLLETPIKRVVTPPDPTNRQPTQHDGSDLSDLLEAAPRQPKPVPKKRVLFNLEDTGEELAQAKQMLTSAPVPALSSTVIQVSNAEEESDWNISSFEDEK